MKTKHSSHYVVLGMAWLAGLFSIAAMDSGAAEPPRRDGSYVVLTDLPDNDPYFAAARRLQEHRSARLIRFSPEKIAETLTPLREAQPAFVAVVVRPETLDINFGFEMLELAVRVDADPFTDFAYGFITGATADDALALVEGTIRAEAAKSPPGRRLVAFGPTSTPQADDGNAFKWLPDWKSKRIEHKPTGFPKNHLNDLTTADVIRFWGHGTPDSVEGGLEQSDLAPIDLRARLVFAGPCLSAVTHRYYDTPKRSKKLKVRHEEPAETLALTFLSNGALTYFGALHDDRCISAGQEMEHALTVGGPVGMTMKHTHDRIAMAQPDDVIRLMRFRDGEPAPADEGLEAYLRWAAARVLIGDPAFVALDHTADPVLETKVNATDSGFDVEVTITDPRVRNTFINPFRDHLCKCETDNDTLHVRAPLPPDAGAVRRVRQVTLPACLESQKHTAVQWREEIWQGKRFLHLQMDFKHDSLAEITPNTVVHFEVEAGEPALSHSPISASQPTNQSTD